MARRTKKELSPDKRMSAFLVLWENKHDGRPVRGAAQRLAIQFNVDKTTINRLWRSSKHPKRRARRQPGHQQPCHQWPHPRHWFLWKWAQAIRQQPKMGHTAIAGSGESYAAHWTTINSSTGKESVKPIFHSTWNVQAGSLQMAHLCLKTFLTKENKASRVAYALL